MSQSLSVTVSLVEMTPQQHSVTFWYLKCQISGSYSFYLGGEGHRPLSICSESDFSVAKPLWWLPVGLPFSVLTLGRVKMNPLPRLRSENLFPEAASSQLCHTSGALRALKQQLSSGCNGGVSRSGGVGERGYGKSPPVASMVPFPTQPRPYPCWLRTALLIVQPSVQRNICPLN